VEASVFSAVLCSRVHSGGEREVLNTFEVCVTLPLPGGNRLEIVSLLIALFFFLEGREGGVS
jgi:hypothetical protein